MEVIVTYYGLTHLKFVLSREAKPEEDGEMPKERTCK